MNNLNGLYIVTEGDFDRELVEAILPEAYRGEVNVMSAGGYSAALSMARSILTARHEAKTILVVDADATDDNDIAEKEDFIKAYLHRISGDDRFAILLQKPEIEVIFFEDKKALEELTGRQFSELEFDLAKDNPKENLLRFLKLPSKHTLLERAFQMKDVMTELRESRLSQSLTGAIQRLRARA